MEQISQIYIERYEKHTTKYFKNNAKELQKIVNQIFYKKYKGTKGYNMDEFYSVATDAFVDIVKNDRYDEALGEFRGYLYRAIYKAIMDEFKMRNTLKRNNYVEVEEKNAAGEIVKVRVVIPDVRIDAPIGENENTTIGETIDSGKTIEKHFFEERKDMYSDKMTKYLNKLSKLQRRILELKAIGFTSDEIIKELNITEKRYADCVATIKAQRNVSVLY